MKTNGFTVNGLLLATAILAAWSAIIMSLSSDGRACCPVTGR